MKFGPVPVDEAAGAILAHSHGLPGGGRLRKGAVLTDSDLEALEAAGAKTVTVARLEPGDLHEDAAALRLATAIVGDAEGAGVRLSRASTGRVNLYATRPGLLELRPGAVEALNAVDPMVTLATLPRWQRVEPGAMLATIKIISYAVPEAMLARAAEIGATALSVRPAALASATLIETRLGSEASLPAKGRAAMAERLERLGVALSPPCEVEHRTAPLAAALWEAPGDLVLVLTASATSDIADVGPAALRAAGGTVTRFGMPVDPGNLLFLGTLQDRPVIGLPGCARAPALNGADWVLERVICDVPVGDAEIAAMGVGGLLKDIPTRPVPRRRIEQDASDI